MKKRWALAPANSYCVGTDHIFALLLCRQIGLAVLTLTLLSTFAAAQLTAISDNPQPMGTQASAPILNAIAGSGPADYVICGEDVLKISVYGAPDFNQTVRVSETGTVELPLIGSVPASGMTVARFQQTLADKLNAQYLQNAQVSVLVQEFHGQPVVVSGAVKQPGVVHLLKPKTLTEVLAQVGGITDTAGNEVVVSRRGQPDRHVNIPDLMANRGSDIDLLISGGDTVRVPKAGMVYVLGDVKKPGGFALNGNQNISVLRALALAEGLNDTAKSNSARIVRPTPAGGETIIPIDLTKAMKGKIPDRMLEANDILVVPVSGAKAATNRGLEAGIAAGIGIITFHKF